VIKNRPAHATLAVLLGLVAFAGCSKGTYLELRFVGAGLPEIDSIEVKLTLMPSGGGGTLTSIGSVSLPNDAAIALPTAMIFKLDSESGALRIDATAIGPNATSVATGTATTTIQHGQTWTVDVDFGAGPGDGGPGSDGAGDAAALDDGGDGIIVTDGSIADGTTGCAAVTLSANESVSLDYNALGSMVDTGTMLWATVELQRQFIGWMKFGLRAIPNNFRVMSANLNLTLATASGVAPSLLVEYSSFDGWTRRTATTTTLTVTSPVSDRFGAPSAGVNVYPLYSDQGSHSWQSDLIDGTVTLGIDNKVPFTVGQSSVVQFAGVDHVTPTGDNRPTLDLVLCR
jgi:hypothetical protein